MYLPDTIKFNCVKSCSACCKLTGGRVYLTEKEARSIASFLQLSESQFTDTYLRIEDNKFCLLDGENQNCIFLDPPYCTIYSVRPRQCRTYPFWSENLKNEERWNIIKKECPGIGKGRKYSRDEIKHFLNGTSLDSKK